MEIYLKRMCIFSYFLASLTTKDSLLQDWRGILKIQSKKIHLIGGTAGVLHSVAFPSRRRVQEVMPLLGEGVESGPKANLPRNRAYFPLPFPISI